MHRLDATSAHRVRRACRPRRNHRALLGLLLLVSSMAPGCQPDPPRPDVLLVVVDTLRADFLGAYGFPGASSPSLDALASRGVVFERALAASTATAPSHASMMTSLWVSEHSIGYGNGNTRLDDEVTLAQRFQQAGYDTAAFIGNIVIQRRTGLDAGFDVYDDELPDVERNRNDFFERTAEKTTERALAWLGERSEAPWFLWVHYQDPHGPYTPPAPFDEAFEGLSRPGDAPLPVLVDHSGRRGIPAYQVLPELRDPADYRARYAGEVAFFDSQLARLLEAAEARGRRLVVAFTSDHGESMGERSYWFAHGHATTPDLARIPFIVAAPGLAPDRRDELVHHVDLMPTLLGLAGLSAGEVRGIALGPFLEAGEPIPERTLFTDIGAEVAAYRGDSLTRRWIQGRGSASGSYRWQAGGSWKRRAPEHDLLEAIGRYSAQRKPLRPVLAEPSAEELDRLRALGYVEDEPEVDDATPPGSP